MLPSDDTLNPHRQEQWQRHEIAMAVERAEPGTRGVPDQMKKRVVPVRMEDSEASGVFYYSTRAALYYRWNGSPGEVLGRVS